MTQVTIRWCPPRDADEATTYKILSDKDESGVFSLVDTVNSTMPYASSDGVFFDEDFSASATTLRFTAGMEGQYWLIGKEIIKLGEEGPLNVFKNCERGVGGTFPVAHTTSEDAYHAFEEYVDDVTFGDRHVIRYHVVRVQDGVESVAAECLALNVSLPPTIAHTTIYGIVTDAQNNPLSNIPVSFTITSANNYHPATGELIYREVEQVSTDSDGYFELFIPRDDWKVGSASYALTIGQPAAIGYLQWSIITLPDIDKINFLLT